MASCFVSPGKASRKLFKKLGSSVSFGDISEYGKYQLNVCFIQVRDWIYLYYIIIKFKSLKMLDPNKLLNTKH